MARKSLVFFVMLLIGSWSSAGQAQEGAAPGNGEVLRWTTPRAQVRPATSPSTPRFQPQGRSVVIPAGSPLANSAPFDVIQTAAQSTEEPAPVEEAASVLKRRGAAGRGPSRSADAGSAEESNFPVTVAARRLGGGGANAAATPAVPPTTPQHADAPAPRVAAHSGSSAKTAGVPKSLTVRCPSPTLVVEAIGPKSVTVGRPANFSVSVRNPGQEPAVNAEVRVAIPVWIETAALQASVGDVSRPESTESNPTDGSVIWQIPEVAPGGHVELAMQVIPRENRTFELGLQWTVQPASAVAAIAVQQPELALSVAGPKDAKFGENVTLLITVANPGTGDAENVTVRLTTGANTPEMIPVGLIPAGQQKQIEVQMTANQPGTIAIASEATADGDIRAENATELLVKRAEIQLAVTGPDKAYTGSPVTYQVRVSNSGTAAAEDTTVQITLPVGAKLEAGTEGSQSTEAGLVWKAGLLPPGIERVFEVQCELSTAGENRFEAKVSAAGGVAASETAATEVQALADLKLTVSEPQGARRVGEEIVYEVTIANRGSKAAEEIQVLVQFSEGIEPQSAEGGVAELAEGQAVFQPIARLGAGQKTVLKVRAKAETAGNHRFRVQVSGDNGETQLVSEGTTRFFGDASQGAATEPAAAPRTAGRPTPARR
ncbi:MAG: CARDB domain-containing protein [Pirellulales bacterium]